MGKIGSNGLNVAQIAARWRDAIYSSPHFIAAAGALLLGAIQLGGLTAQIVAGGFSLDTLILLSDKVIAGIMSGAHRMISGVFAVTMAIGLLMRSRLAWVVISGVLTINLGLWLLTRDTSGALVLYQMVLLAFLIRFRNHFDHSSVIAATIFSLGSIAMLLAYGVLGSFLLGKQFSPAIADFSTALYFSVVTMSTVGYGDIQPVTPEARLYVVSLIILGITIFATSLSTVLIPLIQHRFQSILKGRGKFMKQSGHYVIVSQSALALNTYRELVSRGKKALFITINEPENRMDGVEYIVGSANDLDILKQADCADAEAILALGDDDANNAFVVLAAKELSKNLKTVVAVNDARNLQRVKRVGPDVVIAPTILGSELLAMAVTGEDTTDSNLVARLFQSDHAENEAAASGS
ncbi:MAG: NAD-binding protein [Novosphingobium sp.]|nr:NAD-binding protein [Novosphingobium sp.]